MRAVASLRRASEQEPCCSPTLRSPSSPRIQGAPSDRAFCSLTLPDTDVLGSVAGRKLEDWIDIVHVILVSDGKRAVYDAEFRALLKRIWHTGMFDEFQRTRKYKAGIGRALIGCRSSNVTSTQR